MRLRHLQGYALRALERLGVLLLMDVAPARIGARLEHRPEPAVGVTEANGVDRLAYGGRMVREVVDDKDAVRLAARLLPTLDAAERCKANGDLRAR